MDATPRFEVAWTVARGIVAAMAVIGIAGQAVVTIGGAAADARDVATTTVNFFSYFTILSNSLAAIALTWAVVWFARRRRDAAVEPRSLALLLAATSTYMIITGVVYNTLLRFIQFEGSTVWWSNEILHVVVPLFLLLDVFFGIRRRALGWSALGWIVAFPIVWVIYTLIRGPRVTNPFDGLATWYPYPFLNPAGFDNGYLGVALYVVGIAAAIIAVGAIVVWAGRRRARDLSPAAATRRPGAP